MNNKPPLGDFLTALPALLQAISQRVLRALLTLVARVAKLTSDLAIAVANFFVRVSKWAWHLYCRLELSIVDALSFVLITLWSVRLFFLLLAPAVLLAIFDYWVAAAAYVTILGVAIWRFYTAKAGEVETAAEDQAPIRALLNKLLGWGLRVVLLAMTFVGSAVLLSSSADETVSVLKEQWSRLHSRPSGSPSGTSGAPLSTSSPRTSPSKAKDAGTSTAASIGTEPSSRDTASVVNPAKRANKNCVEIGGNLICPEQTRIPANCMNIGDNLVCPEPTRAASNCVEIGANLVCPER